MISPHNRILWLKETSSFCVLVVPFFGRERYYWKIYIDLKLFELFSDWEHKYSLAGIIDFGVKLYSCLMGLGDDIEIAFNNLEVLWSLEIIEEN